MARLNPGDPLKKLAIGHDRVFEAGEHHRTRLGIRSPAQAKGKPFTRDPSSVKVKNSTGGDLPPGSVLQLGDYLLGTDYRFQDRYIWLDGDVPTDPGASERYCILKRSLPSGDIGDAFVSGCCVARIEVGDTAHKFATPVDGETDLASSTSGPIEILSELAGTGSQHAYVRLGPSTSPNELVQVWGTSGKAAGDVHASAWVSGRIRTLTDPGSGFANDESCWIYTQPYANFTTQTVPVCEGAIIDAKYVGYHDPLTTGSRPCFIAQSPLHLDSEIGMLLSAPWTPASNSEIVPFDFGWPTGWADAQVQPIWADYSSGQHKLKLRWGTWGYTIGYRVVVRLPATIAGTQFAAASNQFKIMPVTATTTLNGVPNIWHDCKNHFLIPPSTIAGTDSGGDTFTVTVTTNNPEYQAIVLCGLLTVDASIWSLADDSYVQLLLTGCDDAVVDYAELWGHSNVMPSI